MSGVRDILEMTKLDEFKAWLDKQGVEYRLGEGYYEVLRIKYADGWQAVERRDTLEKYYIVPHPLLPLVQQFLAGDEELT